MSIVIDLTFDDRNQSFRELASSPVDDVVKRFGEIQKMLDAVVSTTPHDDETLELLMRKKLELCDGDSKCAMCFDSLRLQPISTAPCGHVFHASCMQKHCASVPAARLACAKCRVPFSKDQVIKLFF